MIDSHDIRNRALKILSQMENKFNYLIAHKEIEEKEDNIIKFKRKNIA